MMIVLLESSRQEDSLLETIQLISPPSKLQRSILHPSIPIHMTLMSKLPKRPRTPQAHPLEGMLLVITGTLHKLPLLVAATTLLQLLQPSEAMLVDMVATDLPLLPSEATVVATEFKRLPLPPTVAILVETMVATELPQHLPQHHSEAMVATELPQHLPQHHSEAMVATELSQHPPLQPMEAIVATHLLLPLHPPMEVIQVATMAHTILPLSKPLLQLNQNMGASVETLILERSVVASSVDSVVASAPTPAASAADLAKDSASGLAADSAVISVLEE